MAIKNSVSNYFLSTFGNSIDVFDCPLSGMNKSILKQSNESDLIVQAYTGTFNTTYCILVGI